MTDVGAKKQMINSNDIGKANKNVFENPKDVLQSHVQKSEDDNKRQMSAGEDFVD